MNPIRYRFLILFAFLLPISFCLAHTRLTGVAGVSPTGAATYSVTIDVPKGVGDLKPSIGIAYNSQSGNGVVGWGCSITGLSVITRGIKDVAHDGTVQGVKFQDNDAYYLDGKRLIPVSGSAGTDGAVYAPEGEPLTTITLHSSGTDMYFTADTGDGMSYEYRSRVTAYPLSSPISWYVSKAINSLGQYINYIYETEYYHQNPKSIHYGDGSSVVFEYEDRPDSIAYVINGNSGFVTKRLKSITSKTGNAVYRTYAFTYSLSDATARKFSRLTDITMEDGNSTRHLSLSAQWNPLPSFSPQCGSLGVTPFEPIENELEFSECVYSSGDLNGDGFCDLMQVTTAYDYLYYNEYGSYANIRVCAFAHLSDGNNGYQSALIAKLPFADASDFRWCDLTGNGKSEFIVVTNGDNIRVAAISCHGDNGSNTLTYSVEEIPHKVFCNYLFDAADLNRNGKGEYIVVEKSQTGSGQYACCIKEQNAGISWLYLSLPSSPKRMFVADFNQDGLNDLMLTYGTSYKIYWNNGGLDHAGRFSDDNSHTGTLYSYKQLQIGDFNGDGVPDLLVNDAEKLYILPGDGTGNFSLWHPAYTLDFPVWQKNADEGTWSCVVTDLDQDGRSDVVLTLAEYLFSPANTFQFHKTHTYWLRSNGTSLTRLYHATSLREEDAKSSHTVFTGDFRGQGVQEVGNYGYNCLTSSDANSSPSLRVYRCGSQDSANGKAAAFTDSDGRTTAFTYASMTTPGIYSEGHGAVYPVVDITAPLCVTSQQREYGDSPVISQTNYSYSGFRIHQQGRGLLGFSSIKAVDTYSGRTVTTTASNIDPTFLVPLERTDSSSVGGEVSCADHFMTLKTFNYNTYNDGGTCYRNYMTYPTSVTATDIYGNVTTTLRTYDMDTGCLLTVRSEDDGGDMWRQTSYTYPLQKIGGAWRPTSVTTTQQHADSPVPFTDRTETAYNTAGLPVTVTEHAGTALALTHSRQYDCRGNILSETHSGSGIPSGMTTTYTYDTAGRFPTGSSNGITTMSYTYDIFGNLLSESDVTRSDMPLTTSYTRDAFGDVTFVSRPSGASTFRQEESSTQHGGAYCVNEYTRGGTATYTWYDALGNETYSRWLGVNCEPCGRETTRNARGQITSVRSWTGKLSETRTMTYDELGRLSTENDGAATTSYSYGNRTVTTTRGGRSYTKISDAWGNILESTDPVSSVSYTYHSCGKPATASSGLSTVSMQYDAVGNRTVLDDPDAGCMSYEYDALGRIHRQTDARGVETSFTYDAAGRLTVETCGGVTTSHVYGTSGAEYQRLVRSQTPTGTVDYTYDAVGRVASETHSASGMSTLTFGYHYNQSGQLSRKDFPQGVSVDYHYDGDGNFLGNSIAGRCAGLLVCDDGQRSVRLYGGSVSQMNMGDVMNTVASIMGEDIEEGELRSQGSRYAAGRSLLSGQRGGRFNPDEPEDPEEPEEPDEPGEPEDPGDPEFPPTPQDPENPFHDEIDLITGAENPQMILVSSRDAHGYPAESSLIYHDGTTLHTMAYGFEASTGNLLERTGMVSGVTEEFTYDAADRIVASGNSDDDDLISYDAGGNITERTTLGNYYYGTSRPHAVTAVDNAAGCMSAEQQQVVYNAYGKAAQVTSGTYLMNVTYGPDRERWKSVLQHGDTIIRTTVYADGYERITENGVTRHFYYLDGGALYMLEDGQTEGTFYYAMTDHLGSITALCDSTGTDVFRASYDVWGCQQVTLNSIGLHRGYTGHEMLPELGLINMNGRMYDPETGRFLSPDNYVQMPDYSQSFNRYSYCLNNPLKFKDPDGELWWLAAALIGGAINVGMNINNIDNGWEFLGYFGVGAAAGAFGGVAANAVARTIGVGGAIGGATSGLAGGFVSGILLGGGNSLMTNGNFVGFMESALTGAIVGGVTGAVIGGVIGGYTAYKQGNNFWTGEAKTVTPEVNLDYSEMDALAPRIQETSSSEKISSNSLIHYTNKEGYNQIMQTETLNPSIGLKNARYGEGQYLTNLKSNDYTAGQLSRKLYGVPWNTSKVEYFIKIDVSGLNVIQNNSYNFLISGKNPLNLHGRILESGISVFKIKF